MARRDTSTACFPAARVGTLAPTERTIRGQAVRGRIKNGSPGSYACNVIVSL
jgi:hypothetical protein